MEDLETETTHRLKNAVKRNTRRRVKGRRNESTSRAEVRLVPAHAPAQRDGA